MATDTKILQQVKVREVAGVFRSRDVLDTAVSALLSAGFDRADVDIIVADRLTRRLDPAGERRLAHEAIAPDDVEQFFFRHDSVPFSDQYGEEVEHLRLNRPGLPAPA